MTTPIPGYEVLGIGENNVSPVEKESPTVTVKESPNPFRTVVPQVKKLNVVKLGSDNFIDVGCYILREGGGGVEFSPDREWLAWTYATIEGDKTVRFDLGSWIVAEPDQYYFRKFFRYATQDEVVTYGLGRRR